MKRIITTILAASMMLIGTTAFAQVSVGAGYINSTSKATHGSTVLKTPSNGFYAGLGYDINEGAGFGINTGLYFSYLISQNSGSIGSLVSGTSKLTETYLDVPVRASLSADMGGLRLGVFAGPVFSYGISSTTDSSANIVGVEIGTGKIDNYAGNSGYKRFDILVGGGVNVDFGPLRFTVSYDLGMLNRYDSEDIKTTRNTLRAGLAFLF